MRVDLGAAIAACALVAPACLTTKIVNIGQKTSLENQLMGEAEPLTEEQLLAASVRAGGSGVHAGSADDLQSRAIAARRRQLFNRDDVDDLKAAGCLGEALGARIARRPCDNASEAETSDLLDRLIEEENADRSAIIDWALGIDPVLTPADRPQVVALYHQLVVERSTAGSWVQREDGRWTRR
jgi:hypothetical protein